MINGFQNINREPDNILVFTKEDIIEGFDEMVDILKSNKIGKIEETYIILNPINQFTGRSVVEQKLNEICNITLSRGFTLYMLSFPKEEKKVEEIKENDVKTETST
jgi:hypothetical protein